MSDGAIIALIGLATIIVAGVPATITAFTTRHLAVQARDHAATAADRADLAATTAKATAETIGAKNGDGTISEMMAQTLAQQAELFGQHRQILEWQDSHAVLDDQRITDLLNRIVELSAYTHDGVHALRGLLTPLSGHVQIMWNDYAATHHINETEGS